jgi:ABC-2 type transport system permease protein
MVDSLRLYAKLVRISMYARMQYRADFITGIIGVILHNIVSLGLIGILVSRFQDLNGWTVWELVFLYCLWMLGHSLYSLFFWHVRTLEDYLIQGTFDQYLLRPVSPFLQFISREIQYYGFGDVVFGVGGLVLAFANLNLQWGLFEWVFFGTAIIAGTLIEVSLALMVACLAFWTGRSRRAGGIVMQLNVMVQRYPVDIFGRPFRALVTGFIPVAFMNYYPALMLLGKLDQVPASTAWLGYISPLVAVVLLALTALTWKLALRRYASAGG